jgi:hypothetical protein
MSIASLGGKHDTYVFVDHGRRNIGSDFPQIDNVCAVFCVPPHGPCSVSLVILCRGLFCSETKPSGLPL